MSVSPRAKEIYALDDRNKRIDVLSPSGQLLRRIGGIGQSDRDLAKPIALSCESRSNVVYVIDGLRVKAFRPDGSSAGAFNVENLASSIAVNGEGEVFLSSPRTNKLILKCSSKGANQARFGDLLTVTRAYPNRPAPVDAAAWSVPLSRTFLLPADDGGVFAVFAYAPLVERFDRQGNVLWSKPLSGPAVAEMERIFWADPDAPHARASRNMDGKPLVCFTIGACRTPDGVVLVLGNRAMLFVSADGKQVRSAVPAFESPKLMDGIAALDGRVFMTSFNQLFAGN